MDAEKKNPQGEKQRYNLIYALADYKQLVLQYRTKHAELIAELSFWKSSALWLIAVTALCLALGGLFYLETQRLASVNAGSIAGMSRQMHSLAERFEARERELKNAEAELEAKNARILQLERNLSTFSKKQAEKLLRDAGVK